MQDLVAEAIDLLQQLIRNACVNDGTPGSGQEARSVGLLRSYLAEAGLAMEEFEPAPGRASLVARIEGRDPAAPSLLLMGHTDVVPANPQGWQRDPFGGELVDGMVWGRGAIDMLNMTATMAVAVKRLALRGWAPRGTLAYLAVADEEALGTHGAKWLVDNELDAVRATYVITETGGFRLPFATEGGPRLPVNVEEKGSCWCKLRVRGTPGHGSMPFRTDNALVKAADVVTRLAAYEAPAEILDVWGRFVEGAGFPPELREALVDPERVMEFSRAVPDLGLARMVHAATHNTIAPTIIHGGVKTNVIPDAVDLDLDIRTLPGQRAEDVTAMIMEALGDLAGAVEILRAADDPATASPTRTPLWDSIAKVSAALAPEAVMVPSLMLGATDARFFRRAGMVAYGAGLFSDRISLTEFASMFHGDDERVDSESLRLSAELWDGVARDLLA